MSTLSNVGKDVIKECRGRGLFLSVVVNQVKPATSDDDDRAWQLCLKFMELGLLAKPTHGNIIRLAPPLTINDQEVSLFCTLNLYLPFYSFLFSWIKQLIF